jgi:hypothetical protein
MENHARHMFRAFETAGTSSTVRGSFQQAEFIDARNVQGRYMLEFDESKVHFSSISKEIQGCTKFCHAVIFPSEEDRVILVN